MKKGVNYWCFPTNINLEQACALSVDAGYHGIELTVDTKGPIHPKENISQLRKIKKIVKKFNLEIISLATGMLWAHSLSDSDKESVKAGKAIVQSMLEMANYLEANAILVVPGAVDVFFLPDKPKVRYLDVWNRSQQIISELVPLAEKKKVTIALENVWSKFLLSPREMCEFIDAFNSEYVGAYFDVGNILPFGYPDDWILTLGKRIKRVHVKDYKKEVGTVHGFCDLLEGDVHWKDVIHALHQIQYNGYLTLEMWPYLQNSTLHLYNSSAALESILAIK